MIAFRKMAGGAVINREREVGIYSRIRKPGDEGIQKGSGFSPFPELRAVGSLVIERRECLRACRIFGRVLIEKRASFGVLIRRLKAPAEHVQAEIVVRRSFF